MELDPYGQEWHTMKLKHAAVTMIVGALLTFPAGAHAGGRGGGDSAKARNGLDVRVSADNSGRGSTDVDVRKTKLASTDTRAVRRSPRRPTRTSRSGPWTSASTRRSPWCRWS